MTRTAKKGNPDRVVGYNAWVLPKVGDFQDFGCGEGDFASFFGKQFVPIGGTGRFTGGPNAGLQALITKRLEPGNWCHTEEDQKIRPPLLSQERLNAYMRGCVARRVVPMINLEVYQDGTASPESVALLENMGMMIRSIKNDTPTDLALDLGPPEPVEGEIRLESADGKSHGTYPIYIENVDCFTYWKTESCRASWSLTAPASGKYQVYSMITHGRGGEYQISFGDQSVTGEVKDKQAAPDWEGYEEEALGTVALEKGRAYAVVVSVNSVSEVGDLMNLRRISLRPCE